ncbi:hypothetical protein GIB67_024913 [Kingdonia uniflora]|uniref:Cytochrome P450 n=1 Tax=Kingdonia uniflora TaxID=39325 RepID=A0A7J7NYL0_9MAGN|nr:hypothetical protein GIB67_024913 [Kingdonia uniflora]
MKLLKDMLTERRAKASPEKGHGDFMDLIMEELKKEEMILIEGFSLDLMSLLLFASFETTSSALTLTFKILADYPLVVEELARENESILGSRENVDSAITWTKYKSMIFISMVISKIVRLANIIPGVFRKAIKEVDINGYTIPADGQWLIVKGGDIVRRPDLIFPYGIHIQLTEK